LASIEITSTLEPLGLSTTDGKRPDGLTHFTWKNGKYLIWDWATACTVAPSNLSLSLKGAGKTAEAREKSKCEKYDELTQSYHFTPISSETFGAWGPMTLKFLSDLGKELIAFTIFLYLLPFFLLPLPTFRNLCSERERIICTWLYP